MRDAVTGASRFEVCRRSAVP